MFINYSVNHKQKGKEKWIQTTSVTVQDGNLLKQRF